MQEQRTLTTTPSQFHLLAGLTSGLCSAILLQPVDLLKTRLQQSRSASLAPTIRSLLASSHPITSFWRGTLPSALRTGLGSALYFTTLNALRQRLANTSPHAVSQNVSSSSSSALPKLSPTANLATGAIARSAVGWLMMPVTVLKVRCESSLALAAAPDPSRRVGSGAILAAGRTIYAAHGVRGFFAGSVATLARDAPYAGLYVAMYEACKARLGTMWGASGSRSSATGVNFVSGAVAAAGATAATNPFDVVKTRVQLAGPGEGIGKGGVWTGGRELVRREGWGVLFDGLGLRMGRKVISSALAWTVYEEGIRWAERRVVRKEGEE